MKAFLIGVVIALFVLLPLGIYLYARFGFLSIATTARPLPGEEFIAKTAAASMGAAADLKNPLKANDETLLTGAQIYRDHCAVCHGLPGQPKTDIAAGMFPSPPQLLEKDQMVTDDPEGATHWVISNGIRLSGMPGFAQMADAERWQVTLLLKNADKLPAPVKLALSPQAGGRRL